MKIAFKIWLVAIVYQTGLFLFISAKAGGETALVVTWLIPIELIGGLPGLFLFAAIMHGLYTGKCPLYLKWIIASPGAAGAALSTTLLTMLFFEVSPAALFNDTPILIYLPPLSALLSLLTFIPSINKYFHENTIEETP